MKAGEGVAKLPSLFQRAPGGIRGGSRGGRCGGGWRCELYRTAAPHGLGGLGMVEPVERRAMLGAKGVKSPRGERLAEAFARFEAALRCGGGPLPAHVVLTAGLWHHCEGARPAG